MEVELHEISFILGKQKHAFFAVLNEGDREKTYQAILQDYKSGFPNSYGDVQVFAVSSSPTTSGDMIEAIFDAIDADRSDKTCLDLLSQAQLLDETVLPKTAALLMEFTWDNGGGDDNNFGWAFEYAPQHHDQAQDLCQRLGDWLEDEGHAYGPAYCDAHQLPEEMPLIDALEMVRELLEDAGGETTHLSVLMQELSLQQHTPSASGRKARIGL